MKPEPSSSHWKVTSGSSGEEYWNVAEVELVGLFGPEVMEVSDPAVSTEKLRLAGLASVLPASSVARTSKVCGPSVSVPVVWGVVQEVKVPPSTAHSKVELGSVEVNSKVGVLSAVGPEGPAVMFVSGSTVSTVKVCDAGVGSGLPTASRARTSKVWEPSLRLL